MSDSPPIPPEPPLFPGLGRAIAYLFLLVLVVAGCYAGFNYAKLHLALMHAQREFSTRQFMRAEFWTGRALSVDKKNIQATRLMAEIDEALDNPDALNWRIRVAQIEPENTGDLMAWARCAMRLGQRDMAVASLNRLPANFKNRSAEYHKLMAYCAFGGGEPGLAEVHFTKAVELDHNDPVNRGNLASFWLTYSSSSEVRSSAARELEGLLADSRVSLFAARALLTDANRRGDHARAQRFAEKLCSFPTHNFNDELSRLETLMSTPGFQPALEAIEHRTPLVAPMTNQAGDWLNSHGMADETLRWFFQLPEATQSDIRMQMTKAESYAALHDWTALATFLAKGHWENWEYLRRAMLIRCKRELSQPWEKEWNQLVSDVGTSPPEGLLLAQMVTGWQWRDETLPLLWGAATKPQTASTALQYLWDLYTRKQETAELLRVANAQMALDPTNPTHKNNKAFLSLLLYGPSENSERLAREVFMENPTVPGWVAVYAYALHLAGKKAEAKKLMNTLPPEALGFPRIALYNAIVLAANGDSAKAMESLAKLNPEGMLPEEQKVAADLKQQLSATNPAP